TWRGTPRPTCWSHLHPPCRCQRPRPDATADPNLQPTVPPPTRSSPAHLAPLSSCTPAGQTHDRLSAREVESSRWSAAGHRPSAARPVVRLHSIWPPPPADRPVEGPPTAASDPAGTAGPHTHQPVLGLRSAGRTSGGRR